MKIYHAPNTRSVRIVWLAEELGLPYEIKAMEFNPKDLLSDEYLALNPLGQVPTVDIDGLIMTESGAIAQFLLATQGKGRLEPKAGTREHANYLYWFHFAEAGFMPSIGAIAQHAFIRPEAERIPQVLAEGQEKAMKILGLIEKALPGKDYITGSDFTAADIMLGYDLLLANMFGMLGDNLPATKAYFERLSARPAFKKATT